MALLRKSELMILQKICRRVTRSWDLELVRSLVDAAALRSWCPSERT